MRVRLQRRKLLDHLAKSGLSQNHWAIRIGLSRGHWSDLVNGKHPYPSPRTRRLMVEGLGLPFEELFEVEPAPGGGGDAGFKAALPERYVVDREIGEGAMGAVYLCRDIELGRQVAIKAVSPEAISGIGIAAFQLEVRRTAQLQHPNILPIYDAGEAAGHPFYVMPYIAMGSLRALIESRRRLSLEEALEVAEGIAAALDCAHGARVLHCDVKPENVLLGAGRSETGAGRIALGHAYVADFGLSRAIHSETREWENRPEIDVAAGTPAYVSPEQARGELELDARSDVYSLACVVFEMLSGRPPFSGTTTTQIIERRFDSVPPDVQSAAPHVPESVAHSLRAAMALEPAARPPTAGAFVASLARATPVQTRQGERRAALPILEAGARWLAAKKTPSERGPNPMLSLFRTFKSSFFALLRQPTLAVVAMLTLALGIGANTAMFSIIKGALFDPLAFEESERLLLVRGTFEGRVCCTVSVPNFLDVRAGTRQIERLVAGSDEHLTLLVGDEPERVAGGRISEGFFEAFRIEPRLGRFFAAEDHAPGSLRSVVLSEELWRERFAADPGVLGATYDVNGEPHTVIGVAPSGLTLLERARIWVPFAWDAEERPSRGSNFLRVYGRLASGATLASAVTELDALFAPLAEEYPIANDRVGMSALHLADAVVSARDREPLYVLWGAVALVLLIACANVTNLLLARSEARRRELAMRAALGAGRLQLLGSFLAEGVLLSLAGAVLGIATAGVLLEILLSVFAGAIPRHEEIGIDPGVLAFSALLAVVTGLAVGLVVWMRSRSVELATTLKQGSRAAVGRDSKLRSALVVTQVALASVLAAGAGLLLMSFWQLTAVEIGVDVDELVTFQLELPEVWYPEQADLLAFAEEVERRVARVPGVRGAAISNLPLMLRGWNFSEVRAEGSDATARRVETRSVMPGYFEATGIPLLRGRDLGPEDRDGEPAVVVINRELARQLFGESDPIGRRLASGEEGSGPMIVGMVGDVREAGPARAAAPTMYWSLRQNPSGMFVLTARIDGEGTRTEAAVRAMFREIAPRVPVFGVGPLSERLDGTLGDRRFALSLLSIFAGIGLVLGAVGVYGLMAYSVERRTGEIAVRRALGASPVKVLKQIVAEGGRLALLGVVVGAVVGVFARRLLDSLVVAAQVKDPLIFGASAAALLLTALLACWVPARRAAAVQPMEALRGE